MTRGEVVRLVAPRRARGHEQRGTRPAVIIQADELLDLSTVLIAPTSRSAASATFRPTIELGGTSTRVLTDQVRVVDTQAIKGSIGRLSHGELSAVDDALAVILGLSV